jgi:titin
MDRFVAEFTRMPLSWLGADGGGRWYHGLIDEAAIYSRALSPAEIQTIYSLHGASKGGATILGNNIGSDASGSSALGNGRNGITITAASGNTVGGTAAGSANVIANSGNDGVLVDTGTGNAIRGNSIFSSTNLGIELINNGNNNQAAPVLTSAVATATTITIQGTFTGAANTTYTLEFFANPTANPSGFGEGTQLLGSVTVTTDSSGNATFTVTFNVVVTPGEVVSATATDPGNNTSAFAQDVTVSGG